MENRVRTNTHQFHFSIFSVFSVFSVFPETSNSSFQENYDKATTSICIRHRLSGYRLYVVLCTWLKSEPRKMKERKNGENGKPSQNKHTSVPFFHFFRFFRFPGTSNSSFQNMIKIQRPYAYVIVCPAIVCALCSAHG